MIGANSSPECVALQRRLINITTGGLGDPNLHTLVIGAAQLNTLGEQDAGYLRNVVVRGGNILVLSPDAASKDLFDKNPDIMKKAAEAGGLTSGYTIIWQNLNGPDDSNFTYEVKL